MSPSHLALLLQGQDTDPFQVITNFLESPILRIAGQLVLLLFIILWVALVYWTYTDARRRGALSMPDNLVHGSDSPESAARELELFFGS